MRIFLYIYKAGLIAIVLLYSLQAQADGIRGSLFDKEQNIPLDGASVALCKVVDSVFVQGGITSVDGTFFLFGVKPGNYFLHFSFVGYEALDRGIVVNPGPDTLNVGAVFMVSTDVFLEEAVISGKQSGMRVNNDTVEYFPSAFRTMKNAVVEDLLKKLPGVEIDDDGKIMINGQEVKEINIGGKEFFGNDPKIATKYLPADIIDVLQVVEKKSDLEELTGIDDGNRQYVINLKIKPDKKRGVFGKAYAGAGTGDKYEANVLVNRFAGDLQLTALAGSNNTNNMGFSDILKNVPSRMASQATQSARTGKGLVKTHVGGFNYSDDLLDKSLKVSGNLFVADFEQEEQRTLYRENFLPAGFNAVRQNRQADSHSPQLKTEWKFDYKLTPKTRIIFRPDIAWGKGSESVSADGYTAKGDSVLLDSSYIRNSSDERNYWLNGVVSISHKLNDAGRNLTAEVAGVMSQTLADADSRTDKIKFRKTRPPVAMPVQTTQQISDRETGRNEYRFRLNYNEPVSKTWQINAAYQFKRSTTITDKKVSKWNAKTGEYVAMPSQTNRFDNVFNNHRFELGVRKFWKKINLRAGGVVEPVDMTGYSYRADSLFYTVTKKSVNISPYVNFVCPFSNSRTLRLDVKSSTRQPSATQLQPVRDDSNPNYIRDGNPDLKPIVSTQIGLRYNDYDKAKQRTIVATFSVNWERNSITNLTEYIEDGVQYSKPVNINGVYNYNGSFTYNVPLSKNFRLSSYTTANYNRNVGFLGNKDHMGEENISKNTRLYERLRLTFNNKLFEIGLKTSVRYNRVVYSLQKDRNTNAFDVTNGVHAEVFFPKELGGVEIDYNYGQQIGYSQGLGQSQHLLEAGINFSVLKDKRGVISLKGYDLLRQRQVFNRNVRPGYMEDVRFNTQPRYCMLAFSYRFTHFAKVR